MKKILHLRLILVAISFFFIGVGAFYGVRIFAQTNTVSGPLGDLIGGSDPPNCQAGYFPQEFQYQINNGGSVNVSYDSADWFECAPPAYVFPAVANFQPANALNGGNHASVNYNYALANGGAELIEYGDTGPDGSSSNYNQVIQITPLATGSSGGTKSYGYVLSYTGETHNIELRLTNAAGQTSSYFATVYSAPNPNQNSD